MAVFMSWNMDKTCIGYIYQKYKNIRHEEGEPNLPYTEAVLFDHGCEVNCAEPAPADTFFREWIVRYNNKTYVAEVVEE